MRILTDDKKISWPFVVFMILYYNVDGTVSYLLALLYIIYIVLGVEKGKIVLFRQLWPICMCLFLGVIIGITKINSDFFRDIYYFSQPIIYIYFGYMLDHYKGKKYDFYASLVIVSFILSIIYILNVVQNPAILTQSDNIREIRGEIGKETVIALVGVALITTQKINFSKMLKFIMTPPMVIVFILQFSRANIGTIVIFYIVYYILEEKKWSKSVFNKIVFGFITVFAITLLLPNSLIDDFVARLLRSSTEISSSAVQVWTRNDAYANWRGYEIYLVLQEFYHGSIIQKVFGYGFGHRVLLGRGISLNGLSSIPVFHNGYIQVLNKLGIVGIILLSIFYMLILLFCYKNMKCLTEENKGIFKFVFSLVCGVIFLSYFKGGIFRGTSIIELMLLIGFLFNKVRKGESGNE